MKRNQLIATTLITLIMGACSSSNTEGWTDLFTGESEQWHSLGNSDWAFEENVLVGSGDSTNGYFITTESFRDFELYLEFSPDATVNSGIFIRCGLDDISATSCYEINIWDNNPNQDNRTGSIVGRIPPAEIVETIGKWNTYKILASGSSIKVWVNDIQTVDYSDSSLVEGKICLQKFGTGKIKFRNVKIRELNLH